MVIHEGNDSGSGSGGDTRRGRGRKEVKGRDPIKLPQGCARYLFVSQFQWPGECHFRMVIKGEGGHFYFLQRTVINWSSLDHITNCLDDLKLIFGLIIGRESLY